MKRWIILGILALAACAGPRKDIPVAARIAPPPTWRSGSMVSEGPISPTWWKAFGDPALDAMVSEALAQNDDVEIAAARLEEARAQFNVARSTQHPTIDALAAGGRTRSVNDLGLDLDQWAGQGEMQASFDLDLFGRLKNTTAAARAAMLASRYNQQTVRLAIISTLASAYVHLRTQDDTLDVLQRTLAARQASLALIQRRAEAGYGSQLDLAQAQAEYAATAQAIPPVELAVTKLENGLAILLGRSPGPITRGKELTGLIVPEVPARLPASVLRNRPDLAAAEQQIVAADRTMDAARAAFMPDISLSASGGFVSSSLITEDPLSVFALGGSILAPIFNGGRLKAQALEATARRDQAAFAYRKAALSAFREVEDSMAATDRLSLQEQALHLENQALFRAQTIATHRYREGYSPFLDQLDAQRSLLASELALAQTRGDRLVAVITLYQALGGGDPALMD